MLLSNSLKKQSHVKLCEIMTWKGSFNSIEDLPLCLVKIFKSHVKLQEGPLVQTLKDFAVKFLQICMNLVFIVI
jgi:hypothetical protein